MVSGIGFGHQRALTISREYSAVEVKSIMKDRGLI
jgi:hypothetical protein